VIVDCAVYRDGHREERRTDLSETLQVARADESSFVWIGLHEPSAAELAQMASAFGLHPLAVEDSLKAHQRPKVERYDDSLFVVLKTLSYVEQTSDIQTGELMLFIGDSFVVTVRHGEANPLAAIRHRMEARSDLLANGPTTVLWAVCDGVVDTYVAIADEVERDVDELEARVFSAARINSSGPIYRLKRELLEFRRAVAPLVDPLSRLANGDLWPVPKKARPFFRDVADHVARVTDQIVSYDQQLSDIHSSNLAEIGVRQNADMRRISAWVAIAAAPTMIAAIYGMNFDDMPELHWHYGYYLVLALMAVIMLGLYRAFKRSGWL